MPLKMSTPTRHSTTGRYRVRLSIPVELRATAKTLYGVGVEFTKNLDTADKRTALERAPAAQADLIAKLGLVRAMHEGNLKSLTFREVRAVAGEWYRDAVTTNEDTPGPYSGWDGWKDWLLSGLEHPDGDPADYPEGVSGDFVPDRKDLDEARQVLLGKGIAASEATVEALAVALWEAKLHLSDLMMRRAQGDYSEDSFSRTIPALPPSMVAVGPSVPDAPVVTLDDIVRGWARHNGHDPDADPVSRAVYDRRGTATRLKAFLGHDLVGRITKADAVRWKEALQLKGRKPSSVGNDISEMSALWKWAIAHAKAELNPFAGILPTAKARRKKAKQRRFSDSEVVHILSAARLEVGALRWLPWVLAATGARVSEIAQSSKQDIIEREGFPCVRLHADPGDAAQGDAQRSLKNEGSERTIPLHPRLIEEGFLDYVAALPANSSLWPDIKVDKLFGSRGTLAQRHVRVWLREKLKITDPRISPNHSWRHWFIDAARQSGMDIELRHAITGHADGDNESHRYGDGFKAMPRALADAMAAIRFPALPALPLVPL